VDTAGSWISGITGRAGSSVFMASISVRRVGFSSSAAITGTSSTSLGVSVAASTSFGVGEGGNGTEVAVLSCFGLGGSEMSLGATLPVVIGRDIGFVS